MTFLDESAVKYCAMSIAEAERDQWYQDVLLPLIKNDKRNAWTDLPNIDMSAQFAVPDGWEVVTLKTKSLTAIDAVFGKGIGKKVWYNPAFRGELFPFYEVQAEAVAYILTAMIVDSLNLFESRRFIRPIGAQNQVDVPTNND